MMRELFDPGYGMFRYYDESRLLWFNPDSLETTLEFSLIGILLGVAIYNSIIVDLKLPNVRMYRFLIAWPPLGHVCCSCAHVWCYGLGGIQEIKRAKAFQSG
jgi:hypothetical protein